MNQAARIISIYAADTSGVCSALYEYGGMTVIHDASGCNSTYTTHDEPRWYDKKSMIYISGITEKDAVMGNDDKFIDDLIIAANELKPAFIALCASPLPAMIGTDLDAIAYAVEAETGIPSFSVKTNGMQSYIKGADNAFLTLTKDYFEKKDLYEEIISHNENSDDIFGFENNLSVNSNTESNSDAANNSSVKFKVNILGLTPLDFPKKESVDAIFDFIEKAGFSINAVIGMETDLSHIERLTEADVNLLLSSTGKSLADYLYNEFNIPTVTGVPYGIKLPERIKDALIKASENKENIQIVKEIREELCKPTNSNNISNQYGKTAILGESILSTSLAAALLLDKGIAADVIETVGEGDFSVLEDSDKRFDDEFLLEDELKNYDTIIGDQLFKPICNGKTFIPLAHEAFSGRCFTKLTPNLINTEINLI